MKWEIGSVTVDFDVHRWYTVITAYSASTQVEQLVIGTCDGEPTVFGSYEEWEAQFE